MKIQKQITTGFGVSADFWHINDISICKLDSTYKVCGNISLYLNEAAFLAGSSLIDNATFSYNDLTEAEVNGNVRSVVGAKITASSLVDGEETNLFQTSHSGVVSFQDAVII